MPTLVRRSWVIALMAILLPASALAKTSAKDFIRQQAGKAAFVTDVEKVDFLASEVFRFQMLAVMRMTHVDWRFEEDGYLRDRGQTYSYILSSSAEGIGYDLVQLRKSIERNKSIDEEQRSAATDLLQLLQDLAAHSEGLGVLYNDGDVKSAGNYYYSEVYPRFESIRRGAVTLSSELGKEIKLDALKFKP